MNAHSRGVPSVGIHLALAHAYVRNPTSCLGSTRVPPRKTSHAINVRGLRSNLDSFRFKRIWCVLFLSFFLSFLFLYLGLALTLSTDERWLANKVCLVAICIEKFNKYTFEDEIITEQKIRISSIRSSHYLKKNNFKDTIIHRFYKTRIPFILLVDKKMFIDITVEKVRDLWKTILWKSKLISPIFTILYTRSILKLVNSHHLSIDRQLINPNTRAIDDEVFTKRIVVE